jgi:hypothetical protein
MRGIKAAILAAVLSLAGLGTPAKTIAAPKDVPFPDVPRITTEELKSMLGDESVIILDVRMENQWEASAHKIPGAFHENAMDVESWAHKYLKDKTIVLY